MKTLKLLFVLFALLLPAIPANADCPCGKNCTCTAGECGSPDCPSLAATVVVQLPADAMLLFDDAATASAGNLRTFRSPPLTAGKQYEYKLTATVIRNGQVFQLEKTVAVKAGATTNVTMELPEMPAFTQAMFAPMVSGGNC